VRDDISGQTRAMDKQRRSRFRRAMDRIRSYRVTRIRPPRDLGPDGPQPNLLSPAEPPDTYSQRAKSTRHRKVTADHWNQ
jgi:hypothetical protein